MARMELILTSLEAELSLEAERHAQLAMLAAQSAANGMSALSASRLESTTNRTLARLLNLSMLNLHDLVKQQQAGGTIADVVKLYNLIEDQLEDLLPSNQANA